MYVATLAGTILLEGYLSLSLKSFLIIGLLIACGFVSGCRKSHELETAIVTGKVTLDGKQLDKGTISFTPSRGRASAGSINSDGSFKLSTYGIDDGAIVGHNKASVYIGSDTESGDAPVKSIIPDRYATPATSGLVYEVKPGQANDFHVELKSRK